MDTKLFEQLNKDGLISGESLNKVLDKEKKKLFSIYWELKSVLYIGILCLTSALGILVYKNIDSIGHLTILCVIALGSAAGFYYCFRLNPSFTPELKKSPSPFYDYALLLSCLLMLIFTGYLQYQYKVFGTRYGLATFLPMLVLMFSAYFFDHKGILSMGIANMAAWLGITVSPVSLLQHFNWFELPIIIAGFGLGLFCILMAYLSEKRKIKSHFSFTYYHFATHLTLLSVLGALFYFEYYYLLFLLFFLVAALFFYRLSVNRHSFYFLLVTVLYSYVAFGYTFIRICDGVSGIDTLAMLYLVCSYFILSSVALVYFLYRMNVKMKNHGI